MWISDLAHGLRLTLFQSPKLGGVILDFSKLDFNDWDEEAYVEAVFELNDVEPMDISVKITESFDEPIIPVVLGRQDYGDATVGFIRGQDTELEGAGDFITWKVAVNWDKLFRAWQWLDQPATLCLAVDSQSLRQVYNSQRSAVALEIRGSSQTPISNNITLNYPRGI